MDVYGQTDLQDISSALATVSLNNLLSTSLQ